MGYVLGATKTQEGPSKGEMPPPATFQILEILSPRPRHKMQSCMREDCCEKRGRSSKQDALMFAAGVATASVGWYFFGLYMAKREERIMMQRRTPMRRL